jgi:hypothetical protein
MKSTHILAASIAALCVAQSVEAANVTVRISGSTAFRAATTNAIKNVLSSGNPSITYAGGNNFSAATYATFVGTLPAVTGTVTVKCSWNGSVDGIRDVVQANAQAFLADGVASSTGNGTSVAASNATDLVASDIAMADNTQASTIYKSPVLAGNTQPVVGVVPFAFVRSRGANPAITNTGRQQMKWLLSNAYAPASLWTGNAADTQPVWIFGRDPFSGTRLVTLAEATYGTTTPVVQFTRTAITGSGITAQITAIDQTANGGIVGGISLNDGNNGENSGGNLSDNMRFLSSSVSDGYGLFTSVPMGFITYLGEADANRAVWGLGSSTGYNATTTADRAAFLTYEGVAGFAGEAKNAVAGTITGGNTLTISSVGPVADAAHEGATPGATGLVVGQILSGTGITPGSTIASITLPNIITLDKTQTNGAVSGVIISSFLPATVRNGSYPFWNYEYMLWKAGTPGVNIVGTSGDKFEVAKAIRDNVRTVAYGFSGLDVGSMQVQRFEDGGPISPIAFP